jgi:uncharacterized protein
MNKFGVSVLTGPSVIKDIDAKRGIVVSYPSTFDVVDSGKERVKRGAFNRTINAWGPEGKKRTKVLFNHEPWSIIGRPLVLREDDYGLYAESQIVPTRLGADVLKLIESEVITEQSIGYTPVRQEKNEDDGVVDIMEVKLYEYSFLAWGMNQETPIVGMKGEGNPRQLALEMQRVERALKDADFQTEDIPEMLSRVLKQWREELDSMVNDVELTIIRVNPSSIDEVKNAIKSLESLLPVDPPSGTPPVQDPTPSTDDSGEAHSEALKRLLAKVAAVNEESRAEATAARMLREFQVKLGV